MLSQNGRGSFQPQPEPIRFTSDSGSPTIIEPAPQWVTLRQHGNETQELAMQARDYIRQLMGGARG